MDVSPHHGHLRPSTSSPSLGRSGSVLRKKVDERPGTSNSAITFLHTRPSTATSSSSRTTRTRPLERTGDSLTNHVLRQLDALESSVDHTTSKQKVRPATPGQWQGQGSPLLGGVHNPYERSGRNAVGVTSSSSWGTSLGFHRKGSYDYVGGEEVDIRADVNIVNNDRPATAGSSTSNRRFAPMGFIRRKSSSVSGHGIQSAPSAFPGASFASTTLSRPGTETLSRRAGKENGGGHSSSNSGSSNGSQHNLNSVFSQGKDTPRAQSQEREQRQLQKRAEREDEKAKLLSQSISASAIFPSMAPGSTFTLTVVKPTYTVSPPSSQSSSGKSQARNLMENASTSSSSFARPPRAEPVSRKSISLYETTVGSSVPLTVLRAPQTKPSLSDLKESLEPSSATPLVVLRRPHPYAQAQSIHVEDPKSSNQSFATSSSQTEPSKNQRKLRMPLPPTKTTTVARTPCTYDVTNTRPVRPRSSSLPIGAESLFPTKSSGSAAPPSSFPSSTTPIQTPAPTMSSSPKTATIPAALARARARTLAGQTRSDDPSVGEHVVHPAKETAGVETSTLGSGAKRRQPISRSSSLKVTTSMPDMSSSSSPDPNSFPTSSGLSASLATSKPEASTVGSSSRIQASPMAFGPSDGTGDNGVSPSMFQQQQQQPVNRAHNRRAAVYRPPPPVDANGVVKAGQPKPALSLSMPSGVSIIHPLDNNEPHIRHSPADLTPPNLSTIFGSQTKTGSPLSASPRSARPPPRAQIPESPTGSPERIPKPLPVSSPSHTLGSPSVTASPHRHVPTAVMQSPAAHSPKQSDSKNTVSENYNKPVSGTGNNASTSVAGGRGLNSKAPLAKRNGSPSNSSSDKFVVVGSSRAFYSPSPSNSLLTSYDPKRRPSLPIPSTVPEMVEGELDDHLWNYFEKSGLTSANKSAALPRSRSANVALTSTGEKEEAQSLNTTGGKTDSVKSPGDANATPRITGQPPTSGQDVIEGRGGLSPFPIQTPQTASSYNSLSTPPLSGGISPTSPFTLERHARPRGESNPHPLPSSGSPSRRHRTGQLTLTPHTAARLKLPSSGGTVVLAEPPRVRNVPKPLMTASSAATPTPQRPGHWVSHSSAAALPSPTFQSSSSPNRTNMGLRPVPSHPSLLTTSHRPLLRSSPSIPNLRGSPKPCAVPSPPSRTLQAPEPEVVVSSTIDFQSPFPSPSLGLSLGVTLPTTPITPATPWINGKDDADADSIILPPSPLPPPKGDIANKKAVAHTSTGTTDLPYLLPQTPLP